MGLTFCVVEFSYFGACNVLCMEGLLSRGTQCTQCNVLYVGKYWNPSVSPFGEHLTRHARGVEIQPCGPPKQVPTPGAPRVGILALIRDALE